MGYLYLVRHGQASAGTHDYDRLSETGRQQSHLLGEYWKHQGFVPDAVFHGSLVRQRDTAQHALNAMEAAIATREHGGLNEYDHRVIEKHFSDGLQNDSPENMTFEQYVSIMQRWRDADSSHSGQKNVSPGSANASDSEAPALELWSDFARRGWDTVSTLHQPTESDRHEVFFTSGGIIATLVSWVLSLDFMHTVDAIWRIRNSSITTLYFDGTHARLVDFNTVPHLQAQHDHQLITLI